MSDKTKATPASAQLGRIFDALAESIINMSDVEILAEMTPEDHEAVARLRERMLKVVDDFKAKQQPASQADSPVTNTQQLSTTADVNDPETWRGIGESYQRSVMHDSQVCPDCGHARWDCGCGGAAEAPKPDLAQQIRDEMPDAFGRMGLVAGIKEWCRQWQLLIEDRRKEAQLACDLRVAQDQVIERCAQAIDRLASTEFHSDSPSAALITAAKILRQHVDGISGEDWGELNRELAALRVRLSAAPSVDCEWTRDSIRVEIASSLSGKLTAWRPSRIIDYLDERIADDPIGKPTEVEIALWRELLEVVACVRIRAERAAPSVTDEQLDEWISGLVREGKGAYTLCLTENDGRIGIFRNEEESAMGVGDTVGEAISKAYRHMLTHKEE